MKQEKSKETKYEVDGPAASRDNRNSPPIPGEERKPREGEIRQVEENANSNKTHGNSVNHSAQDDGVTY
jgi:hypothetical protein